MSLIDGAGWAPCVREEREVNEEEKKCHCHLMFLVFPKLAPTLRVSVAPVNQKRIQYKIKIIYLWPNHSFKFPSK